MVMSPATQTNLFPLKGGGLSVADGSSAAEISSSSSTLSLYNTS